MVNRAKVEVQRTQSMLGKSVGSVTQTIVKTDEPKKEKKKGGCGCQKRKEWLNKKIPGSGDLVEKVTTVTGIKGLVDFYFNETSDTNDILQQPNEDQSQDRSTGQ